MHSMYYAHIIGTYSKKLFTDYDIRQKYSEIKHAYIYRWNNVKANNTFLPKLIIGR